MQAKVRILSFRFRAFYLKYLLRLLGLAGFGMLASCAMKYGSPYAEYGVIADNYVNIHGTVLSEDSLKPIKDISVKFSLQPFDTFYSNTNQQGVYNINHYISEGQVTMIFNDTDGNQNGSFFQKNINFEVSLGDLIISEHKEDITLERKP